MKYIDHRDFFFLFLFPSPSFRLLILKNCFAQNYRSICLEPEQEIKIEVNSDTEDESNHGEQLSRQVSEDYFLQQKRPRIKIQGESIDLEHRITCPDSVSTSRVENGT